MPKEYITRLVLDKHHKSLLLLKQDTVVGGICFHPFYENGFIEIAFLAITADEQVKGYGTYVMNHLKTKMQEDKLYYFLTYADNFAVGYFKKQGFTKYVTMPREKWAGFIKDYDGGTLMECHIHPSIDYLHIPDIVTLQRSVCISFFSFPFLSFIPPLSLPFSFLPLYSPPQPSPSLSFLFLFSSLPPPPSN